MRNLKIVLVLGALLLGACNFSLAADITPPPGYVPPTPMPTLGALYPLNPPDPQRGAALYAQYCAACHGARGLGDGPQGIELPVTVPALALAEIARPASPAEWFRVVTQGNLDRFMPPFVGTLSDQQRWDVVAYLFTLHTTPEQVAQGQALLEAKCAGCAASFRDAQKMAALSEEALARMIRNGEGGFPSFGTDLSEEEAYAIAAYARSLTFGAPATPGAAATPTTTAQATEETPAAGVPLPSTPAAQETPVPGRGVVRGTIQMAGATLPSDLTVTLRGFEHGPDQSATPQEVLRLTATPAPDGSYQFEDVEMPAGRIFIAEANYKGIGFQSDFEVAGADTTSLALPPLTLYEPSEDVTLLKFQQVHIYTDFATAGRAQFLEIYSFTNPSDKAVILSTDGTHIPFIQLPEGAQNSGYEAGQNSAPFVPAEKGVAVLPGETPYSIIAFFSLPYDKKVEVKQPLVLDAPSLILLIPEGMKVGSAQLANRGLQVIQNNNYQIFSAEALKAGEVVTFTISGRPRLSSATGPDARQVLMLAGGALGVVLIAAGLWLYLRERRRAAQDDEEEGFQSAEEVLDAILALDDLHRAGKLGEEAYRTRRQELKEILRELA